MHLTLTSSGALAIFSLQDGHNARIHDLFMLLLSFCCFSLTLFEATLSEHWLFILCSSEAININYAKKQKQQPENKETVGVGSGGWTKHPAKGVARAMKLRGLSSFVT